MIQAAGRIAAIGYEDGADLEEAIKRAEAELIHATAGSKFKPREFKLDKRGLGYSSPGPIAR